MLEDLNESLEDLDEGLPEPSDLLATLPLLRMREEILPLFNGEDTQKAVKDESPKLILKPLPTELKYAYLEENKQSPIVISSSLTTTQEMQQCDRVENFGFERDQPFSLYPSIYMEEEAKPVHQP